MRNKNTILKQQNTVLKKQNEEFKKRQTFLSGIDIENIDSLEKFTIGPNYRRKDEAIAISTISDVHIEEPVIKSVVSGLNEYNLDIAKDRVTRYFKRLLYMINQSRKAGHNIDNLVVGFLGDFITGYIHEELEENNLLTPSQATLFIQELLIKGIKLLSSDSKLKKIIIPCVPGNHGRTTRKKRYTSGYKNSYEWLMYNNIKRLFDAIDGYENVELIIPESEFIYLDLFGYVNKFSHGDHFNYQGGIGGLEVPLKNGH